MIEVWKDIPNYEGYYKISNLGRVKSLARVVQATNGNTNHYRERILSYKPDGHRYAQVTLHKDHNRAVKDVHRLVAEVFIPNPNNLPCVNHKDWNVKNNSVENLEWCTKQYNNAHRSNCLIYKR